MSAQNLLKKVLSSRLVVKAVMKFDQTTAIVVGLCWLIAFIMIIIASVSVNAVFSAKKEAFNAISAKPVLPVTVMTPITMQEEKGLLVRLKRDFPDLAYEINANGNISIESSNSRLFQEWIGVLSYIDAMSPQYRWEFVNFCVGKCKNDTTMQASVTGKKISFAPP